MRGGRGFTLLEVLVALAILAVSAAAILRQTQLDIRQQEQLELKSAALWVADDAVTSIMELTVWPPLGSAHRKVTFGGRDWDVVTDVSATAAADLRKIEVSVNPDGVPATGSALVRFTTYRGRY